VYLLVLIHVVRGVLNGCALVFPKFLGVDGWGLDGWFLLVIIIILAFCLGRLLALAGEVFCFLSAI
jgi:hypothetical protein